MLFNVRRQRIRGVPLSKEVRTRVVPARGDLRVEEGPAEPMGRRLCRVATLHAVDRVVDGDSLPPLYDARLLWMAPLALVLGGIEFEGGTGYWQTWYCTPLDRHPLAGMDQKPRVVKDSARTRGTAPTCEAHISTAAMPALPSAAYQSNTPLNAQQTRAEDEDE